MLTLEVSALVSTILSRAFCRSGFFSFFSFNLTLRPLFPSAPPPLSLVFEVAPEQGGSPPHDFCWPPCQRWPISPEGLEITQVPSVDAGCGGQRGRWNLLNTLENVTKE